MHILILNFEYPPLGGGASPVCHEINKRYVRAGHRVSVVTMHFRGLAEQEVMDGVETFRVPCARSHIHICNPYEQYTYLIHAKRFLKKWLPENDVDVVHAHFAIPSGILCRYLKRHFNIPYIITSHGSDIPGFNPDRFRFLHIWTPPLIRAIIREAAFITSPSAYLKNLIEKSVSGFGEKIKVIPNGIDHEAFQPAGKINTILTSGRLLPRKGFHDLVRAVHPMQSDFTLHILGDGPIREKLKWKSQGSQTPVIMHGWVDNKSSAYKHFIETAAIYSLVSARENASISLLEAMAAGCAIITSDQSGCPEMVGDAAILVRHGHPDELRKAIQFLIDQPQYRLELGQKAMLRARTIYNWDGIVDAYLSLLKKTTVPERP